MDCYIIDFVFPFEFSIVVKKSVLLPTYKRYEVRKFLFRIWSAWKFMEFFLLYTFKLEIKCFFQLN